MTQLADGSGSLVSGLGQLDEGSNSLKTGLGDLHKGTGDLADGSTELADGSTKLLNGQNDLTDGSKELQTKLADAKDEADVDADEKTYNMEAEPVELDKKEQNAVENYGTGFAPYFISMGLLVGALVITVIFNVTHPSVQPTSASAWYWSKTSVLLVMGFFQAIIIVTVVKLFLGLHTENLFAVYLMALVASYTFIGLVQMFVSIFNDVGRYIMLVFMVMQLTSSAGTFPLEMLPSFFQKLNTFMPMTYSIQGFKAAISTGDMPFFWKNIAVLVVVSIVAYAITFMYFLLVFKKRHSAGKQ